MASSDDLVIDLTNYKDTVGARVKPGRYRVQVEDAERSQSSTGNPMVILWLRVSGGDFDGQTIVDRLTITSKSLFRIVGFLSAIGLPTPKKRFKLNVQSFVGRQLDVDVDDGEPYMGRVKSEVRGYVKVAKSESASVEVEDLDDAEELSLGEAAKPTSQSDTSSEVGDIDEVDLEDLEV